MAKTILSPAQFKNVVRKSNPLGECTQFAYYGKFHENTTLANSELSCIIWSNSNETEIYAIYALLTTYKNRKYNVVESTKVLKLDATEVSKLSNLADYFNCR